MAEEQDALKAGDTATFKLKRSISEEARKQQEQQDAQGVFNFLPQFPRSFYLFNMFGKFSNIIPEETEDAVNRISTSPEKNKGNHSITEEVKKLGLTAEPQPHTELKEFEPKWIKAEPKVHYVKGHARRHSGGVIRINESGDMTLQTKGTVDDNAMVEGQNDGFHAHYNLSSEEKADSLQNDMVDFSDLRCIPQKNATKSAIKSTSMARNRGKLFRPQNEDEMNSMYESSPLSKLKRGELFRVGTGMRRSKSTSNLDQSQEIMKVGSEKDISQLGKISAAADDGFDVSPESFALRRISSTGSLQRLQSGEGLDKLASFAENEKDKENKTDLKENSIAMKTSELSERDNSQRKQNTEKPVSKIGETLNSLGKQTVQWATTSKVKQKKREHHAFSPTSF